MGLRDGELGEEGVLKFGAKVVVFKFIFMFMFSGTGEVWFWAWRWMGSVWMLNWRGEGLVSLCLVGDIVHGGVEMFRGDGRIGV